MVAKYRMEKKTTHKHTHPLSHTFYHTHTKYNSTENTQWDEWNSYEDGFWLRLILIIRSTHRCHMSYIQIVQYLKLNIQLNVECSVLHQATKNISARHDDNYTGYMNRCKSIPTYQQQQKQKQKISHFNELYMSSAIDGSRQTKQYNILNTPCHKTSGVQSIFIHIQ